MGALKTTGWWVLTGSVWVILFPVTAVIGWTFMIVGGLVPVFGVINLGLYLLGWDPHLLMLGTVHLNAWLGVPITIAVGAALFACGWLAWKLTTNIHQFLLAIKPQHNPHFPELQ
ncbi:MAG: hypothetical protein PT944_04665 [Actinomycetaceae bacterium]|nr:hypothetical protein [Arcanobacterium sp.]MDD7687191.1 hypothetical protein [Actinomycetaceae bacterium]MDY5273512.1 hypothetical protein [Arcanobacterium sp.]